MDKNLKGYNRYLTDIIVKICDYVLLKENSGGSEMELPQLSVQDCDQLFNISSMNGVLPVVMQVFEKRHFEDAKIRQVVLKWYGVAQYFNSEYQKRLLTMRELATMFAEKDMDVMFFKGAALAQYFPKPEWRVFSDIDFYLYGKWKEGVDVMEQHGIANRLYFHHNTEASLHGILLENHYDFIERVNHKRHLILDDKLKELAKGEGHKVKASFMGEDIKNAYVMTPTMNAIFLLRHMAAHFASETVTLRMLMEWTVFLKKEEEHIDWDTVVSLYKAANLMVFAGIIQHLQRTLLGTSFTKVPQFSVDEKKAERVWDSIANPPESNPYNKNTLKYLLFEGREFLGNRWKHKIVYPHESYFMLSLHYAWSIIKRKLGLLKV